jgi:hypothetical protein
LGTAVFASKRSAFLDFRLESIAEWNFADYRHHRIIATPANREEKDKARQLKGCAYCVLEQLGVKNTSGDPLVCRKAEFLTHIPDIKLISKAHALQCAKGAIRNPDLLKIAEEAIEAYADFRKGPNPNARGRGKGRGAGAGAEAKTGDK